jgi:AraC-like DNA-binding protein
MSDLGVLYTEHADLRAATPVASLWSYEAAARDPQRRAVTINRDGNCEYWLEPWDPLLNTMLPGTGVSVVVTFADRWAAGRSLATSALLPRLCVVGPVTQSRIVRVGVRVQAIGAVLSSIDTASVFGVPASALVDHIVPLDDLWAPDEVEQLYARLSALSTRVRLLELCGELVARVDRTVREPVGTAAARLIAVRGGQVSIDRIAASQGLSRRRFASQFSDAAGMTPKLFARITRFQSLVHSLLSSDVSQWASMAPAAGFYDQAHMINEFRDFAGAPPTVFFQPHDDRDRAHALQLRGRPSEWSLPGNG